MIESFSTLVINFVILIVKIVLTPIDALLVVLKLDYLAEFLVTINNLIDTIISYVPFIKSLTLLPDFVIVAIVDYFVFRLTISLVVWVVKLAIAWYNALKF